MQERLEPMSEFVVAHSETAKLFESIEEPLHEVTCLVSLPVVFTRSTAVATRRDDGFCARGVDALDEGIAVVPLVSDHRLRRDRFDQRGSLLNIRDMATGENQAQRITQGIHARMDLGGQSASRAANGLIATVFLSAPAEC